MIKYSNSHSMGADVPLVDQEKAFGTIDHNFHVRILKHMGFSDRLIFYIEIILRDVSSQKKVNSFLPEEVSINRGV